MGHPFYFVPSFRQNCQETVMQASQQYRVRLAHHTAQQVQALAELWSAPIAGVLRLAVEYAMQEPDQMHALLAERYGVRGEGDTSEQHEAGQRYLASLEPVDLGILLADNPRPLPY
jgi:hypothetical protein